MKRFGVLFILFLTLAGFSFVPAVRAQTTTAQTTTTGFNPIPSAEEVGKVVDERSQAGQTSKEVYSINSQALLAGGTVCLLTGCNDNPESAFYYGKSPLAMIAGTVNGMYTTPPASFAYWLDDVGHDLGFAPKPAYAQGIGFSGFSALLPLWKVFRNIAYFLLAVMMIVIGFMVMFRRKIDPKTVVTVQNALPRIVLTLLLITFSYAIVGLMIDLMYLISYLAVALFKTSGLLPTPDINWPWQTIKTPEALYTQGGLIPNITEATKNMSIYRLLGIPISAGWGSLISLTLGGLLAIAGTFVNPTVALAGGVVGLALPVLQLLLSIALIFLFIRLLIFFLSAYIQVVIALLFGPIQIMFEAVPGTNSFASWLQNLIANLAVFPIGTIFFMLSAIFGSFATTSNAAVWAPGLAPLVQSTTAIASLMSLGILFAIPTVGGQIKEALKVKPFVSAGPEGIVGSFSQPIGLLTQGYQIVASHQMMSAIRKGKGGEPPAH